jgi:hypothetical protein
VDLSFFYGKNLRTFPLSLVSSLVYISASFNFENGPLLLIYYYYYIVIIIIEERSMREENGRKLMHVQHVDSDLFFKNRSWTLLHSLSMDQLVYLAAKAEIHWRFTKHEIVHGWSSYEQPYKKNEETRLRRISIAFLHESSMKLVMWVCFLYRDIIAVHHKLLTNNTLLLTTTLSSPWQTVITASVYFHRFYMKHSIFDKNPQEMTMACLFLAGKVEETPIRSFKLINHLFRCNTTTEQDLTDDSTDYKFLKTRLLICEELLLETMGFDMLVVNPCVILESYIAFLERNSDSYHHITPLAFDFIRDR